MISATSYWGLIYIYMDRFMELSRNRRLRLASAILLASIPALALTAGIPFANRLEPRVFGFPFLIAYLVVWVILTPGFLYLVNILWTRE